jgi:UDP-glucose 4-epimerase
MGVCLVTGGAGFIGSHLVEALLAQGRRVRVLDDLSTGSLDNLAGALDRIELSIGDVRDLRTAREATEGADRVFCFASPVGRKALDPAGADPFDAGALQVLIAARELLVQRVVYASSLRVYGPAGEAPRTEEETCRPVSSYAAAKLHGEQDCSAFTHLYGLETVRLRYSTVFGPRQRPSPLPGALVAQLAQALRSGERPVLPGDGLQPQDLLYVEDAVQAALLAAEARDASGQVFNIGRGVSVMPLEIATWLGARKDCGVLPLRDGPPAPPEFNNLADISRARRALHFHPAPDLEAELARCVEYYRCRDEGGRRAERPGIIHGS